MKKAKFTDYIKDWQYEVANGDTVLGFKEWLEHKEEANQPLAVDIETLYSGIRNPLFINIKHPIKGR